MAGPDFVIAKGDLLPAIEANLVDSDGNQLNLSGGWSVKFYMATSTAALDTPEIDGATATIVTAANGLVSYSWVSGDTDTPGSYVARWKAFSPNPDNKPETFPNMEYITILITDNF